MTPALSIIMPCWLRPQRTERAIRSVLEQTRCNWELLCVGDACPVLPEAWERVTGAKRSDYVHHFRNGGCGCMKNMLMHEGAYGTQCLNAGLDMARAPFVCFLGNDDFFLPDHVATRLDSIEGKDLDAVYHDALIRFPGGDRIRGGGELREGIVGGSEFILRTELAKQVRFQSGAYGHDWTFIKSLHATGAKIGYFRSATYVVTHLPGQLIEQGID
ncbi:MAG: glycosyltransferase [Anaerolineae bacterium]|nr:glycosyltransferase [Phycisphaerae bacterium]